MVRCVIGLLSDLVDGWLGVSLLRFDNAHIRGHGFVDEPLYIDLGFVGPLST